MSDYSRKPAGAWKVAGAAAVAAGLLGIAYWYRRPIPSAVLGEGLQAEYSLLDQYLPQAEFAGEVSVNIYAPVDTIFAALQRLTINDMPFAKWLGTIRYLPGLLVGKAESVASVENRAFVQVIQAEGGNIVLAEEPDSEIVFGAIGKFHNLIDQQVVPLSNADDFVRFSRPGYQKLAISFRLIPLDDGKGYRLALTHRTHALSREARWKFALYWLGIKPGGNFISWLMLRAIKSLAEKATVDVALRSSI
jgi:hypothetical protein